jgi:hypothetical protein
MQVSIDESRTPFGSCYVLIAVYDKFHLPLIREFYSYEDAYRLTTDLFKETIDPEVLKLFKRKGSK